MQSNNWETAIRVFQAKAYIAFGIEDAGYYILQAGFGDWHDHFELYDDEEKNIKEAFKFFKNLVAGECFMIKKVNEKGKYLGGAIIDSKIDSSLHAPISLSSKGKNNRLLKVEFNKPYEDYKINDT